jgi:hypothetical protein
MKAIETSAVFDENGKINITKLPIIKNKKVKLIILIEEDENDSYSLSTDGLAKAYSDNEPEYDLSVIKEPNTAYERR